MKLKGRPQSRNVETRGGASPSPFEALSSMEGMFGGKVAHPALEALRNRASKSKRTMTIGKISEEAGTHKMLDAAKRDKTTRIKGPRKHNPLGRPN